MSETTINTAIEIANKHRKMVDEAIVHVPDYSMTLPMFEHAPPLVGLMIYLADYLHYWWATDEVVHRKYPQGPQPPTKSSITDHYLKDVQWHWDQGWATFIEALRETDARALTEEVQRGNQRLKRNTIVQQSLAQIGFCVGQIVLLSSIQSDSKWNHDSV